jgi:hypothetical protein
MAQITRKTLSDMKTNVGNLVQDTSTAFKGLIGVWLNDKYEDIWRRGLWSAIIDDDYTFEGVDTQANYDLPADFEEELFVANVATGEMLKRWRIGPWWQERYSSFSADAIAKGTPSRYVVLKEVINSSGKALGVLKLDPPASVAETYGMPYKRKFTELLGTTDTCTTDTELKVIASAATFLTDKVQPGMRVHNTTDNTYGLVASVDSETQLTMDTDLCPDGDESITVNNEVLIPNIETIMELGATGEAWAYKRNFPKANYYLNRYEIELRRRLGQERTHINQRYQMISQNYRLGSGTPLMGWESDYSARLLY